MSDIVKDAAGKYSLSIAVAVEEKLRALGMTNGVANRIAQLERALARQAKVIEAVRGARNATDNDMFRAAMDAVADALREYDANTGERKVCPTCRGTGANWPNVEVNLPCPRCKGTGVGGLVATGDGPVKNLNGEPCPACHGTGVKE